MHLIEPAPSWFDPTSTVWLQPDGFGGRHADKSELRAKAQSGDTHITREVGFKPLYGDNPPTTIAGGRHLTTVADKEFDKLRGLHMGVPDTEWYVRETRKSGLQIIAHVAVVEGFEVNSRDDPITARECLWLIMSYKNSFGKLWNMGIEQCMFGNPAGEPQGFYMVDIEPRLTRYNPTE